MEKILEHIEKELEEVKYHIETRYASDYKNDSRYEEGNLYDLNMDKYPVCNYIREEISNHAFDLGKYYTLIRLKELINKNN